MDYNKLVRDYIPDIIASNGEKAVIRIMDDEEYIMGLEKKLDEEVAEYHESKEIEELADILEVVYALCKAKGHSTNELIKVYEKKHNERGGFSKRIFLLRKEEK
ncbi:MAG: nucleoside triphosphate pyrophosphohydrolase [Oscillospiraceae bacterium]|nr:nucleoside triphosphate pyrophosphohydrolase [Oscillospiraceae bacterium]